jgi:anti-sigma factor RsiW
VDFLMAYLDGELAARQSATFDAHMADCPGCKTYLDTYAETIRMGKLACDCDDELPADVPEALVQAILRAREVQ